MGTEITVISSGSAEPGLNFVAEAFQKKTGHAVKITYNLDEKGSQRLDDGEIFDVVVGSSDSLNRNFRPSGLIEEGGGIIGRTGIGIMVRSGAPVPDISSVEALKRAALEAQSILLTNHSSGYYIDTVLKKMGIYEQVEAKITRFSNGPEIMDRVLKGNGKELGFLTINQIQAYKDKGLVLVGPLPEEVQLYREFIAVPTTQSPHKEVAREFVRFCGGPGKPLFVANGFL